MFRKLRFLIFSVLFFGSSLAVAQEKCNNGIDDDGDGLIDCNDTDCQYPPDIEKGCNCNNGVDDDLDGKVDANDGDCASFFGLTFVGDNQTDCAIPPPNPDSTWVFKDPPVATQQNPLDTQSKMAIGDLDGDGIPEIVATSKANRELRIIASGGDPNWVAGDIIEQFGVTGQDNIFPKGGTYVYELEVMIADIDGDGNGEVFSYVSNRQTKNKAPEDYYLVAFDYTNEVLTPLYNATFISLDRPGIPGRCFGWHADLRRLRLGQSGCQAGGNGPRCINSYDGNLPEQCGFWTG